MARNLMSEDQTPEEPTPAADREQETCNIVMKGGITSGVVYPLAVVELHQRYRFVNIGGTSAGAIAAALTAAAEHNRAGAGFDRLAEVAQEISTLLPSLFQPVPRLRPLFRAATGLIAGGCVPTALARLAVGWWPTSLLGLLPAAVLGWGAWLYGGWGLWLAVVALALLGVVATVLWRLVHAVRRDLPRVGYALCPGTRQRGYEQQALTEWLSAKLDTVAGLRAGDEQPKRPLTFGDLWGPDDEAKRINLELMTTNLTFGRPYRLPFDTDIFLFREGDLQERFPLYVVQWMVKKSEVFKGDDTYRKLPPARDLPVIVAARMSLSFPILLAAVQLYARDFTLRDRTQHEVPQPVWFSDGGICSNFPIHLFDDMWPQRPTFGISLETFRDAHHDEQVEVPDHAGSGILHPFQTIGSTGQFLGSVLDTMQEWQDNLLATLPGFRERVARVRLKSYEGGLNLEMPPPRIKKLTNLGSEVGKKLCNRFDAEGHRWTRWLVSMEQVEALISELSAANQAPDALIDKFVANRDLNARPYNQLSGTWRQRAMTLAKKWAATVDPDPAKRQIPNRDLPHPKAALRLSYRY